jgi:ribonuclease-3
MNEQEISPPLEEVERALGLSFKDGELLRLALSHRSWAQPPDTPSNERLEFLGDALLGLTIAEHLYARHPDWSEGELTKLKAVAVSEITLAAAARRLGLGRFLLLARGEEMSGGRERPSLLANTLEALIAAIYLDRGLAAAREFVLRSLEEDLRAIEGGEHEQDCKTALQELVQEECHRPPSYRLIDESGPDHDKTFVVEARLGGAILGVGTGKSKKEAEQAAARDALASGLPDLGEGEGDEAEIDPA